MMENNNKNRKKVLKIILRRKKCTKIVFAHNYTFHFVSQILISLFVRYLFKHKLFITKYTTI